MELEDAESLLDSYYGPGGIEDISLVTKQANTIVHMPASFMHQLFLKSMASRSTIQVILEEGYILGLSIGGNELLRVPVTGPVHARDIEEQMRNVMAADEHLELLVGTELVTDNKILDHAMMITAVCK